MLSQKLPRNLKSEQKYPLYWCGAHDQSAEVYEETSIIFYADDYASWNQWHLHLIIRKAFIH